MWSSSNAAFLPYDTKEKESAERGHQWPAWAKGGLPSYAGATAQALGPKGLSLSSFLTLAVAKRDFGLTLWVEVEAVSILAWAAALGVDKHMASTYLPTCLLRKADSFAVQGLMMLSEGEI